MSFHYLKFFASSCAFFWFDDDCVLASFRATTHHQSFLSLSEFFGLWTWPTPLGAFLLHLRFGGFYFESNLMGFDEGWVGFQVLVCGAFGLICNYWKKRYLKGILWWISFMATFGHFLFVLLGNRGTVYCGINRWLLSLVVLSVLSEVVHGSCLWFKLCFF